MIPVARVSGGMAYRQEFLRTLEPSYRPDTSSRDRYLNGPEQKQDSISQDVITSALRSLQKAAEDTLEHPIDDARIIVPTYFNR